MEKDEILKYITLFENDHQLKVWHFAILSAILYLAFRQRHKNPIKVSRSRIMLLSHIKTLPTYHKYFKELQEMGYIKYTPSYHPGYQSEVELLKF